MAQIHLSVKQVRLLADLVNDWLTLHANDEEMKSNGKYLEYIELGIKAIDAGSSLDSAHPCVKAAYAKREHAKCVDEKTSQQVSDPDNVILYHISSEGLIVELPGGVSIYQYKSLISIFEKAGYEIAPRYDRKAWHILAPFVYRNALYRASDVEYETQYKIFCDMLVSEVLVPLSLAHSGAPNNIQRDVEFKLISSF